MPETVVVDSPQGLGPMVPERFEVISRRQDTADTWTLELARSSGDPLAFAPGQFTMLSAGGGGEVPISISGDPDRPERLVHTVRAVGLATEAICASEPGRVLAARGPFGEPWPVEQVSEGAEVVIAAGGIGLAPLRPAIYHLMRHRKDYGRVHLLYGSRTPGDLLYSHEYDTWRDHDIEVTTTVDIGDGDWRGNIGVVPVLFYRLRLNAAKTHVLTCGPEIMIRFVVFEALARKIAPERIHLSMERNMNCAIGQCGHCQIGPVFVCKDGPVFTYERLRPYLHVEEF